MVSLIVNDGTVNSTPDTVTISTINVAPIANAGAEQSISLIGITVQLNGTQSYDPDANITSFVPDVAGTYVVQLVVNDGDN